MLVENRFRKPGPMTETDWQRHQDWLARNAAPKLERKSSQKWSHSIRRGKSDLEKRIEWLNKRAQPKKDFTPKDKKKKEKKLDLQKASRRLKQISKPRPRNCEPTQSNSNDNSAWKIKTSALFFKPTKRLISLSQPKCPRAKGVASVIQIETKVTEAAMRYEPSVKITNLARPKTCPIPKTHKESEVLPPPLSKEEREEQKKRLIDRAKPKALVLKDKADKEMAYIDHWAIKEATLKVTASKRIQTLAQPKIDFSREENQEILRKKEQDRENRIKKMEEVNLTKKRSNSSR